MLNKINFTPGFASTQIRLTPQEDSLYAVNKKFLAPVNKYFELADINVQKDTTPQQLADEIDYDKYIINYNNGKLTLVGKDGGIGGADTFIGKILTNMYPDRAVFKDDIRPSAPSDDVITLDFDA